MDQLKIGRYSVVLGKNLLANTVANKKVEEATNAEELVMTREDIFNIPDNDYEFMQKIANNVSFYPTNESEVFKYNSLVNHGYFEKDKTKSEVFKPTKKGNEIIAALKSIYFP
jgi:predicted transcriptional regulator